jgi:uncharacterized membrane protein
MLVHMLILAQSFSTVALDLGSYDSGEVVSIDDNGEACGWVRLGSYSVAAKWTAAGKLIELGHIGGTSWSTSINASGFVLGDVYHPNWISYAPYLWGPQAGTVYTGMGNVQSVAINDTGDILLQGTSGAAGLLLPRAGGQVLIALSPGGYLLNLDNTGAACGRRGGLGLRWSNGVFQDLLPPPGFSASAARDLVPGSVVGISYSAAGEQATSWDSAGTPTLLPYLKASAAYSGAYAVNSHGWVVGREWSEELADSWITLFQPYAVLWVNGVPQELPLASAWDLNDRGQIVGLSVEGKPLRLDPH